jgi:hypothetical protein
MKQNQRRGRAHVVKRNRKRSRGPTYMNAGVTTMTFSTQVNIDFSIGVGVEQVDIFPHAVAFSSRFSAAGYLFENYRIRGLEYCIIPTRLRSEDQNFAHAVLPTDDGALTIGTFAQLCQMPQAKIYDARMITLQWNKIQHNVLMRQPTKWWSTTDSGNTKSDFVQCSFVAASASGRVDNSFQVLFKLVVDFTGAADNGASLQPNVCVHEPIPRVTLSKEEYEFLAKIQAKPTQ